MRRSLKRSSTGVLVAHQMLFFVYRGCFRRSDEIWAIRTARETFEDQRNEDNVRRKVI